MSEKALTGAIDKTVGQSTHFHADYVDPWWREYLLPIAKVGRHIFYSWPGSRAKLLSELHRAAPEFAIPDQDNSPYPSIEVLSDKSLLPDESDAKRAEVNRSPETSGTRASLFAVDLASPNGRWAVSALELCANRKSCTAIGYSADTLKTVGDFSTTELPRPAFLLVRDAASGMTVAQWDCQRVARAKPSECLPSDGPQLRRLMRDR